MTYDDLVVLLKTIGLPVIPPGQPAYVLPCITVEPVAIEVRNGDLIGWEVCNVVARFPSGQNDAGQFHKVNELAFAVLRTLIGQPDGILVSPDVLFGTDNEASQPNMGYTIEIMFPGPYPICRGETTYLTDGEDPPSYLVDDQGRYLTVEDDS